MTDEQDIMRVIDDAGAPADVEPAPAWKVAVIDDDAAVHEGTRFALYDYSLHGQSIEILSAFSGAGGPRADALGSGHRRHPARRGDGDRRCRPQAGRLHPHAAQERGGSHHLAHRAARPGARAAGHRRLRHQRLQGQDRADRRQAVHLAHRGAAQLSADPAHGGDAARAGDDHRGRLHALRLQVDAAPGGRRADADRLAPQRRVRRHPGVARRRREPGEVLGARRLGLLSPLRRRGVLGRSRHHAGGGGARRLRAPHASIPAQALGALHPHLQQARGRGRAGDRQTDVRHRPLPGRGVLQPAFGRLRQRHSLRPAARGEHPAGGARARAHPRAHRRQPAAGVAMDAAAPLERVQERDSRHRGARPAQSARRHPGTRRDDERARHGRAGADRQDQGSARPYPGFRHPIDRDGQRPDHRRDDGRAQYRHPARAGRPGDDAGRDREHQPGAGGKEEAEPAADRAGAPGVELRSRPAARGGRQPHQQRHQVQPDRREHRADHESRRRAGRHPGRRRRPGPVRGGRFAPVRPLSAAVGAADRRRELDRARAFHRQAHRRAARRPCRRAESGPRPRHHLHDPPAGCGISRPARPS